MGDITFLVQMPQGERICIYSEFYSAYLAAEEAGNNTLMTKYIGHLEQLKNLWMMSVADIRFAESKSVAGRSYAEALVPERVDPKVLH